MCSCTFDLHPRAEQGWAWCHEPFGQARLDGSYAAQFRQRIVAADRRHEVVLQALGDEDGGDRHGRQAAPRTFNSVSCAVTALPQTVSDPIDTGSLKRRGPALPGLTKCTPSRISWRGRWVWPATTT